MAVLFKNVKSIYPKPLASSWEQLRDLLAFHEENAAKTDGALWSPVEYYPSTTRGNRNVRFIEALVVDMDGESFREARLDGLEWFAYTTWSHRPNDEHWHLVLPLKDPVPAHRWAEVWTRLHERINVVGDPATKDPARIFYLPQHPVGRFDWSSRKYGHGEFLDAGLGELFVPPRLHVARMPRTVKSHNQAKYYWQDEAWWNEPQDLSRFAGMTQQQVAVALRSEFADLRKSLSLD